METDQHWETRLRQLEDREQLFLQGLDDMDPDEMRWLVRFLMDALTEERWRPLLAGYHEHLPAERMRQFLERFIPECIQLAALDLQARRDADGEGLHSLTDTDLQGMSALEKWQLIAKEPRVLDPERTARELARLALCFQSDLLNDAMLPRAVIEFPLYFRMQEALRQLPATEIHRLADHAAASVPALDRLPPAEAGERLAGLRQEIAKAAGFTAPLQELLGASMDRLPGEFFPPGGPEEVSPDQLAEAARQLEGHSPEELRLNLQILADQLSLPEAQVLLGPHQSEYPSLSQMPTEVLRRVVATLVVHLAGRGPCDFIQRYRRGKFLAVPPVTSEVWNLLPQEGRLGLLRQDNAAMDLAQIARHLARILLSHEYQALDDDKSQMAIVLSPLYQRLVQRLTRLADQDGAPTLLALTQTVTEQVLAMEQSPREGRGEMLDRIRRSIGGALGPSEEDFSGLRSAPDR
ncbi:MAG: hypothetical protein HYW08_01485 [candidate division NC10 bacterium]|nr:hypothetical protein [candidate division NC10 bacterium]